MGFTSSTMLFYRRIPFLVRMLMMIKHQVSAPVARLVESARMNVRIMMGVASQKLDGANETVRKGSGTLRPAYVKVVEMMGQQKYAAVVLIVSLVKMSVRKMKDVAGNQQLNVRPTVKRSGVVVNALVVPHVDRARVNVRITMVVASLKLDTVNEIVRKGSGTLRPAYVKAVEMINQQKYAAVVILVVHASESVKIMKVVAGNQQENARGIVNRSGVHVKFYIFTLMVSIVLFFSKIQNEKLFHQVIIKIKSLKDEAKIYSQKIVYECIKFH